MLDAFNIFGTVEGEDGEEANEKKKNLSNT